MWANYLSNIKKEEAENVQRCSYSEMQETNSLIGDISYLSARNRFDSNGSSSGGQSSEAIDFPLHFSYQSLSDIWTARNSSDSSTDESHELSPSIPLVNQPSSNFYFENTTNPFSVLGSRSINIIKDANVTAEESLESAIKEYRNDNMSEHYSITLNQFEYNERGPSTSRTERNSTNQNYEIIQMRQSIKIPLQQCVPYNNIRLGNHCSQSDMLIPFRPSIAKQLPKNLPNQVGKTLSGNCSFCMNNKESAETYSNHSLRTYENGQYVLTCPVLLRHVCEICGATGIYAHTRTHCPVVISHLGQKPKPLAKLIKDTPRDAAGRFRKNMP